MTDHPFNFIRYEVFPDDKIAVVTLTNPPTNVAPFWAEEELLAVIDRWEHDDNVKVVIIRGEGENFCAGHDFKQYRGAYGMSSAVNGEAKRTSRPSNREQLITMRDHHLMRRRLFNSFKPTIAEIRGLCVEWGNGIQVCCDISIAALDAQLGNLGQTAGLAGIGPLRMYAQLIGFKRAREMCITGRTFSGREAAQIGLVNRAVPAEQLQSEAWEEAKRIALIPLDGLVTGKAYAEMVFEGMGIDAALSEAVVGFTLGLKIKVEDDEFGFIREVGRSGASNAIAQRKARYEPLGGFGPKANKPIVAAES